MVIKMYKKKIRYENPMIPRKYKRKNNNGYEVILDGITWVQEHRIVVENFIGRKLTKEETVHHISGNKQENDISNLMLFNNLREHREFERRIKREGMSNEIKEIINNRWKKYGIK